nr:ABC transporter substrate-binding protein [uncultured Roseococcus sp.]
MPHTPPQSSWRRRGFLALPTSLALPALVPGARAESALTELRIACVSGSVMPQDFRAGIQEGFFRRQGLDLKLTELATGPNNITAAVNGSAGLGFADIFAGLSAIKNGFDIGLVAPHNGTGNRQFFLVRGDSPRREARDLTGARIALGAPPQFRAIASAVLAANGVDPRSIRFSIVPDQTTFGAILQSGQADVAFSSSVVNSYQWIRQYGFRAVLNPDTSALNLADGSPIAGWWATRGWFGRNQEVAERFSKALRETIDWYGALSPEQKAAHVKTQTSIDLIALDQQTPGVLEAATTASYAGFSRPVELAQLNAWINTGNRYANVPNDIDVAQRLFPTATS